jgi:hypothetical protein
MTADEALRRIVEQNDEIIRNLRILNGAEQSIDEEIEAVYKNGLDPITYLRGRHELTQDDR